MECGRQEDDSVYHGGGCYDASCRDGINREYQQIIFKSRQPVKQLHQQVETDLGRNIGITVDQMHKYFLATLPCKKWQLAVGALFCTTFLFCQDFYLKLVVLLYPTYEDTEYLEGGTSYINILRCTAVLAGSGCQSHKPSPTHPKVLSYPHPWSRRL